MIKTTKYVAGEGRVEVVLGVGTTVKIEPFAHRMSDYTIYGDTATYYEDGEWKYASKEDGLEATVDATPEIQALWAAKLAEDARLARETKGLRSAAADAAKLKTTEDQTPIGRGDFVKIVKGRKVPKGLIGQVFWVGEGKWGYRVGLTDAAGDTHWTAASNCQKLPVPPEKARRLITEVRQEQYQEWKAAQTR